MIRYKGSCVFLPSTIWACRRLPCVSRLKFTQLTMCAANFNVASSCVGCIYLYTHIYCVSKDGRNGSVAGVLLVSLRACKTSGRGGPRPMRPQRKEDGRRQCCHTREHTVMGTEGPRGLGGTSPCSVPRGPLFRRLPHREVQPSLCAEGRHPPRTHG